jgi:hypothetical protein
MSKLTRLSPARLKQIVKRQDPPGFGPLYETAIRANREEAPTKSRPAWVWWERAGRDLSTLSRIERAVLLICLHNHRVWEIHDQRMLPPMPRPHPLGGHPKSAGLNLPPMRGTVDVADSLGLLKFHPFIRLPDEPDEVPFPWIGDLLLFLEDDQGPYNVNLTIKDEPSEFEQSDINGVVRGKAALKLIEKTKARHAVEAQLYADAGIRTVQLTKRDYDDHVVANLKQIYLWHKREHPFSHSQREEIVARFNESLVTGVPALEVAWSLSARHGWTVYDTKVVFYQALWHRQVRIDLQQPLLFDTPLRAERIDVLETYRKWFER